MTSGPGVTVPNVPNPGSDGGTFEITIVQSWSQETNYARVTQVWVYPDISGSKEKPKSSIVFRSTRVLSCTLRLVACGFEVSYCPTDNQPLGATIKNRQFQSLDLDGEQSQVQVPPTTAGQKVPMVIDLHGKKS